MCIVTIHGQNMQITKIQNRADLKEYLKADKARYGKRKPGFMGWVCGDEGYVVCRVLRMLRWLEYYTNKKKTIWDYIPYYLLFIVFRRERLRTGIQLNVNTIGKGIYIPHFARGIYANGKRMGDNCIIFSGVVLGEKGGRKNPGRPTIGNNVEICVGAKVIGGD